MKIRTKIFALVATLSFVAIVTAAVGINTLQAYNQAVDDVRHAASRAFYGERLNRLVTHVVMEARGIYASKDTKEAQKFGEGLVATLKDIDVLLKEWEPLVPASNKALFDAVVKDAAEFKTFRTETVRLGAEVSPTAANAQGNTDANRANRKAFQVSIDALTKRGSEDIEAVNRHAAALKDQRFTLLVSIAFGGTIVALLVGWLVGHRQIARPLKAVTEAIQKLASGDYNLPKASVGRDEVGDIWKATQVFAGAMQEAEMLRQAQADTEKQTVERRRHEMMALAQSFEGSVGGLVQHLSVAAQQMEATARSMATTAQQTNQQSNSVAAAAEESRATCRQSRLRLRSLLRPRTRSARRCRRPPARQRARWRMRVRRTRSSRRWPKVRRRSARWSRSSTPSRARPIFSRSMPPSRQRGPERPARALPWWPRR